MVEQREGVGGLRHAADTGRKLQYRHAGAARQQLRRIVRLERLEVEYKSMISLTTKEGTAQVTSKKDFCRLLKGAHLLLPDKKAPCGLKETVATAAAR